MKKRIRAKLMKSALVSIMGAMLIMPAFGLALLLGDAENGEEIHTSQCAGCHAGRFADEGNEIYTRENRNVKTVEGLMRQVELCNANTQNGTLSAPEVDDIVVYLNEAFYRFD